MNHWAFSLDRTMRRGSFPRDSKILEWRLFEAPFQHVSADKLRPAAFLLTNNTSVFPFPYYNARFCKIFHAK